MSRAATLATEGYVVIPDVLTGEECDRWSSTLDDAWQHDQVHLPPHPLGDEPGVQFVRSPLRHSAMVERCIVDPLVREVAASLIGDAMIFQIMNSRRAEPGCARQPFHDLARRRGRPHSVCNTIWCLDEFTADNGATSVLPGTHLDDRAALARMGDPQDPHPDQVVVTAPRGAVIVFSSQVIHAGGANRTDAPRRSMQCNFAASTERPWYPWHQLPAAILAELSDLSRSLLLLDEAPYETEGRW